MKNSYIWGYFGLGNIGDDLMFCALDKHLNKKNTEIVTRKKKYQLTSERHLNFVEDTFFLIFADQFHIPGGNVFSNERFKSKLKIVLLGALVNFRKIVGKQNYIYSAGLNLTMTNKPWRIITILCLKGFNNVELRDKLSFRYIRRYGNLSNLEYKYDSVYLYWKIITDSFITSKKKKYLTYFISETAKNNNRKKEELIQISSYINRYNSDSVLIICQAIEDLRTANIVISMIKNKKCKAVLYSFQNISDIIFQISKSKLIITERYHGGIIAEALGIKWMAASETEKLTRMLPNKFKINENIFN